MILLHQSAAVAIDLVEAIHTGDLGLLQRLLADNPGRAAARIEDNKGGSRTPLHIATDWPGYFPNGAAVVSALCQLAPIPTPRSWDLGIRRPLFTGRRAATMSTWPTP